MDWNYIKSFRNNNGRWPEDCRSLSYFIAELIRLTCGGGLAVAFWKSEQINGPLGAVMIGIATPIIVEKLSQMIPKANYGDN